MKYIFIIEVGLHYINLNTIDILGQISIHIFRGKIRHQLRKKQQPQGNKQLYVVRK